MDTMKDYSPVHNCYRAILSLVNHLDAYCINKDILISVYAELSELAFYIMEDDEELMGRAIKQMKQSIAELKCGDCLTREEERQRFALIIGEINTHLDFLLIEYGNRDKQ